MGSSRRGRIIAAALVGVTFLGAAGWLRMAPLVDDDEVAEALRDLDQELRRSGATRCERPVLSGDARPGDGTRALRGLLDVEGRFAQCLALDGGRLSAGLHGTLEDGRTYGWSHADAPIETGVPMLPGWGENLAMAPPPYPADAMPASFREALAACRDLPEAIHAVVAYESVCSPWRVSDPEPTDDALFRVLTLMKALRVLARDRVRGGEPFDGLVLLLEGAQLSQDLGRGHVNTLVRMIAVAAEASAQSELQTLLALDLGLDGAQREDLRARVDRLASGAPSSADMERGELLHAAQRMARPALDPSSVGRGAELTDPNEARLVLLWVREQLRSPTCPPGATLRDCLEDLREAAVSHEPPSEALMLLVGPRRVRDRLIESTRSVHAASMQGYVARLAAAWARTRGIRALVGFYGRRGTAGCPGVDGFVAADLALPELGGALGVHELVDGRQLELHAPRVIAGEPSGEFSFPLLLALCPGLALDEAGRLDDAR